MMQESDKSPDAAVSAESILREIERKEQEFREMEKQLAARKEDIIRSISLETSKVEKDEHAPVDPMELAPPVNEPTGDTLTEETVVNPSSPVEEPELPGESPEKPAEDSQSLPESDEDSQSLPESDEDELERYAHLKEEVEEKIKALEEKKKEESRKKEDVMRNSYRSEIAEFEALGYNTGRLIPFFVGDIGVLRAEVMKFMADIRSLKEVEARLDKLDFHGIEDEVTTLLPLLHDPESLEECRHRVDELEEKINARYRQELDMKRAKISELRDLLDNIEEKATRPGHKKKIDDIKQLIYKPDASLDDLEFLSGEMNRLKEAVEGGGENEEEKHRDALKREIEFYKKKGYRTSYIENTIRRAPIEEARAKYMQFLAAVESIETIRKDMEEMERNGFEEDFKRITFMLHDPSKFDEVTREFGHLKHRMQRKRIAGLTSPAGLSLKCKLCGEQVPVTSDERPLKLTCSNCGKVYNLKKKPQKAPAAELATNEAGKTEGEEKDLPAAAGMPAHSIPAEADMTVPEEKPGGATVGVTDENASSLDIEEVQLQTFCPFCGAELLPESTFCGMCGNSL